MRILISNDDGVHAPGLAVLADALADKGTVVVVAPDRNRSGASNSLTLDRPLRIGRAENGFYHVNGTPTDCVHIAITELLKSPPDLVVSGINAGENLGDDVLYSGTVAAAMEGCFMGARAIAVSLAGESLSHYETAGRVTRELIERMDERSLRENYLFNVNVPDIAYSDLHGLRVTRLGQRHKKAAVVRQQDPRGRTVYWIGPSGPPDPAVGPGTDFDAIAESAVSVTPLHTDLTAYAALDETEGWLVQA
jgi:5'-nucleotidase